MSVIYCERCGEKLNPAKAVWLAFDQRTQTYTDEPIPAEFDQGGFSFGSACANRERKRHLQAQETGAEVKL